MLLSRIQQDLFEFTKRDPDDFAGLVEFWYRANSDALSAALTAHRGLNLILNVRSFSNFESLAKRLFLIADTLILRDARSWADDSAGYRDMPVPTGEYRPGFLPDALNELRELRPSPLALHYRPNLYWTSDEKILNNGLHIAYAGSAYHPIPSEVIDWIGGPGGNYMRTGQVVCAPFIPPLEIELEFLKHDIDLPGHFGAASLFHQRHDWLSDSHIYALLSLDVPFLDGLDIATLSAVKQDNRDAFSTFSRSLTDAVIGIKSAVGTEAFVREVRNIQRNQIDAALNDVEKAVHRINQSRALRKMGILTGLVGLNAAALIGAPDTTLVTGLASGTAAMIAERVARLKERGELTDKKGYFLWTLKNAITH
ncbi:hypothetical protein [Burkholderia stagnalis]|uniref:hypothetical protein n=1 Tax=Burkholderia stagnalis TaxID=1503054 RepID=UPI000AEDA03D|nr:hypothetical protein [Burkholderia stagnalis]